MAEIEVKEIEPEDNRSDLHTSLLVDLMDKEILIERDKHKDNDENSSMEQVSECLVKNMKHSNAPEEEVEGTTHAESPLLVVDIEKETDDNDTSESQVKSEFSVIIEKDNNISNKAWWKSDIGSESNIPDFTLYHQGSSPPTNDGNVWKLCSPEEESKLNSENSSEILKERAKNFSRIETSEEFNSRSDSGEKQLELESSEDKKLKRAPSSNLRNVDASNKLLQYSRDQLLMLMSAPASGAWPEYFDVTFKKPEGKMDLEKWVKAKQEGKFNGLTVSTKPAVSSASSNSVTSSDRAPEQDSKRSKDPRERIKQELHGGLTVVLSPQRKSFGTGCHVTQQSSLNIGGTESNIDRSRELPVNRRIGSGRIARREDHDQITQSENRRDHRESDKDIDQRRDHKSGWRSKNDNISSGSSNRFDREDRPHLEKRRRFFDDDEKRNERRDYRESRERRYNNNNNNHRRTSVSKDVEETPEWFTGGPSSQNEFIELVGFDEPEKDEIGKQKSESRNAKKENDGDSSRNSKCVTPVIIENVIDEPESDKKTDTQTTKVPEKPIVVEPSNSDRNAIQFNVEDYIGSILNFGSDEMFQCSSGGSRLKQFFNSRESPVEDKVGESHSKRSSPRKESLSQMGNLFVMGGKGQSLEEIEANLRRGRVGGQMMNMGAGLGNNTHFNHQHHQHGFNVNKPPLSPLMRPNQQQQLHNQQNPFTDLLLKNGDIPSTGIIGSKPTLLNSAAENELLAKLIRGGVPPNSGVVNVGANMNNSLLSLNVPPSRPPPPPITNLNIAPPHNLSPANAPSLPQHSPSRSHLMPQQQPQHSSTNNPDIFIKLMQNQQHKKHLLHPGFPQQQQQQQSQQSHRDPIKQLLGGMNNLSMNTQQNQDITRDVNNLCQRVAAGHLSESQLIAQLNSGNLTANQREAVATVLKLLNCHLNSQSLMPPRANLTPSPTPQAMISGGIPLGNTASSISPRVASPNPDANMLAPHMIQQARVSPLMFGSAAPRRPPSHQELVVHAQSILQKALLKNELERAKEKHRKREAAERTRSPNPVTGVSMQNGPTSINSVSMNRSNQQDGSPTKGSKCQSPLAFTPISVLRKMTAEKDRAEKDKHDGYHMSDMDKLRDAQNRLSNQQNASLHHGAINLKPEKKNPLPSGNSMLGPRAQMVMSGAQTSSMMHLNNPHVMSNQRHLNLPQNMPLSRNSQQNIRVMQHQQQQQNTQMMRNTVHQHMNNLNTHPSIHSRMQNPQGHIQNMGLGNNTNYKTGESSLSVPKPMGSQNGSPINFMNFFGHDVLAKVQAGGMPELPGGKALSLEEVERQQTQAVPN